MTIRKSKDWGDELDLAPDTILAMTDAELAGLSTTAHNPIRLSGGDLLKTLGGSSHLGPGKAWFASIDKGICCVGSQSVPFVAHVVLYPRFSRVPRLAVMNAEYLGDWDLVPKGHPNDGYLDLIEVNIPRADRREFRRRAVLGDHLNHPDVTTSRVQKFECEIAGRLVIDGVDFGRQQCFTISLVRDAVLVAI